MAENKLVAEAKELIGKVSYVFGADDIEHGKGDCSAFTHYLYAQNTGVEIGRTTGDQYNFATKTTSPQEGDLIFFKNTYASGYTDGVSHVGIYIGGGEFIHNSSSGGVKKSRIDESYYASHLLGYGTIKDADMTGHSNDVGLIISDKVDELIKTPKELADMALRFFSVMVLVLMCLVFILGTFDINVVDMIKKKVGL